MTPPKVQLPIASAVLGIVLAAFIFFLPKWDSHTQSQIGRVFKGQDGTSYVSPTANQSAPIVLRKTSDGWALSETDKQSWGDEVTRIADGQVPDAVVVVYNPPIQLDSGFLALTRREVFETLVVWPNPDPQAELQQRTIALQRLIKNGSPPDILQRLAKQNVYAVTPLYGGYYFNGVFAIVLILLLWSLSWVLLVPSWIQIAQAQKRLSRGQCPFCLYSLKDLHSTNCPECGAVIRAGSKSPDNNRY